MPEVRGRITITGGVPTEEALVGFFRSLAIVCGVAEADMAAAEPRALWLWDKGKPLRNGQDIWHNPAFHKVFDGVDGCWLPTTPAFLTPARLGYTPYPELEIAVGSIGLGWSITLEFQVPKDATAELMERHRTVARALREAAAGTTFVVSEGAELLRLC